MWKAAELGRVSIVTLVAVLILAIHVLAAGDCDSLSWSDPHLLLGNPGTELGTRVTFSCIEGWILNGSSSSVCESDGWSDPIPTCTWEGLCPELLWSDPNLRATQGLGNRTIGNWVRFSCVDGYHLNSSRFATCQSNGTWDHPQPSCVQNICSDFELSHGNFTVEGNSSATVYTNGTRVTLFCDEGYGPTYGSDVVICLGGAWLPARPECNLVCDPLVLNPGVKINSTTTSPGSIVEFSCEGNLIRHGNSATRCSFVIGIWVYPSPTCLPETCLPLNLSDGMVPSSENRTVGTVITFSCNPGKQVSEDIATACFPGGNWSALNLPTCVDVPITSAPVQGLTGAQAGGLAGGLIIGLLLVIFITVVITAILTRIFCAKKMQYSILSEEVALQEEHSNGNGYSS